MNDERKDSENGSSSAHGAQAMVNKSFYCKLNLQSRCFFLGPITSSVVALHTDLAKP